jgi:hypothetical protein
MSEWVYSPYVHYNWVKWDSNKSDGARPQDNTITVCDTESDYNYGNYGGDDDDDYGKTDDANGGRW